MVDRNLPQKPWIVRFFAKTYAIIRGYFAFVGLLITLSAVAWGIAIYQMLGDKDENDTEETGEESADQTPATIKLVVNGKISGRSKSAGDHFLASLGQTDRTISLPELRATLQKAKSDPKIAGLYLVIQELVGNSADLVEFRRVLAEFKTEGKKIHCVLNEPSNWNYYIASVSNHISVNPASSVELSGPAFTLVYFGEGLKKLGIEMEVVKAGKYKSAFEPFTTNTPSEPTLEQYQAMRTRLLGHMVQAISEGRGKGPEVVHQWFKQSLFSAEAALEQGLVDGIGYQAPVNAEILAKDQKVAEDESSPNVPGEPTAAKPAKAEGLENTLTSKNWISYARYASKSSGTPMSFSTPGSSNGLGLIEAQGEITMSRDESIFGEETGISPEPLIKRLRWAAQAPHIKAVVFKVNSPGGSAVASDIIWNEVRSLASIKPVVVSMGAVAASGGYYIAAPASYIVAEPTTITGSIGVIGMLPKFKDSREKYGISFHVVTGSDRKSLLNPGVTLTEDDRRVLESSIDATYKIFLDRVASGRKLPIEQVGDLAQGRVYTGMEAKELGLVDDIGGYQMAVRQAKILGGLNPERLYPLHRFADDELDFRSCLSNPLRCLRTGDDSRIMSQSLVHMAFGLLKGSADPFANSNLAHMKEWLQRGRGLQPQALWPDMIVIN